MPKNLLVTSMFGVSYSNLLIHFVLNLLLGIAAVLILGTNNNAVLFFILTLILSHSFATDLMPHHSQGWMRILHSVLEEFIPTIFILFILAIISKDDVPWKGVFISLFIVLAISLFLKGILSIFNCWLSLRIAQLITGLFSLVFLGGIFILPSLLVLLDNYEAKNKTYLFFAQINPLIVNCNIFGLDPFHADQLYHYFGSNFLVPKMDGINSLIILSIFAAIFWLLYGFWGKEKTATNDLL